MSDRKSTVEFNDDQPNDYAARIARAKGTKVPLGGAPMPAIPRLDQAPPDRNRGVQSSLAAAKVLTPEQQQALAEQGKFRPGVGSAYAQNQPPVGEVAAEPTPSGSFVNPPRPEGAGLRPETVKDLERLAAAQKEAEAPKDEKEDEEDDTFEVDEYGNRVTTPLNNKKRREAIESRCAPLSIDGLITGGEVRQRVPIIPGKFEPTFRSVGGDELLFVKRLMSTDRGSDQYMLDKFSLYQLTLGLYAINSDTFPTHLNKDLDPEEALFKTKFKIISKIPSAVLADLSINYGWFGRRLEKLMTMDNIKGF